MAMMADPTGERVIIGGHDGTLRIIDAQSLEERLVIRVSHVRLDSMWMDDAGIWTVDQDGMMRCR